MEDFVMQLLNKEEKTWPKDILAVLFIIHASLKVSRGVSVFLGRNVPKAEKKKPARQEHRYKQCRI